MGSIWGGQNGLCVARIIDAQGSLAHVQCINYPGWLQDLLSLAPGDLVKHKWNGLSDYLSLSRNYPYTTSLYFSLLQHFIIPRCKLYASFYSLLVNASLGYGFREIKASLLKRLQLCFQANLLLGNY